VRSQREERKECRTLTRTLQVGGATTTTARLATRTRTGQPTSIQNPSLIFHVLALLPPQAADRATAPRAHLRSAESFAAVSGSAGSATEVKTSRSKGAAAHWDGSGSDGAADAGAAGAGESTGDGEGGARDGLDASLQTLLEGGARLLVELDAAGLAEPLEASLLQGRSSLSRALRQIASPLCAAGAADGRASHGDGDDRDAQLLSTNEHLRALLEDGAQLLASLEEAGLSGELVETLLKGRSSLAQRLVLEAAKASPPESELDAPQETGRAAQREPAQVERGDSPRTPDMPSRQVEEDPHQVREPEAPECRGEPTQDEGPAAPSEAAAQDAAARLRPSAADSAAGADTDAGEARGRGEGKELARPKHTLDAAAEEPAALAHATVEEAPGRAESGAAAAGAAAPCLEETACGEAAGSGPAVAASTAAVPERTLSAPSLAAEPAQPAVAATAAEGASRAEAHSVQVHSGQVAELAQEVWVQLSYEHKVLTLPLLSPARARALCVPVSPRLLSRSLPDAAVPADALAYTIAY
jgi:hypothetical protein